MPSLWDSITVIRRFFPVLLVIYTYLLFLFNVFANSNTGKLKFFSNKAIPLEPESLQKQIRKWEKGGLQIKVENQKY